VNRALAAAQAILHAGAFDAIPGLLATAEAGTLDEARQARVDLLHGQVALASRLGGDAPPLLLKAARRLEPFDLELARETYLSAWGAAVLAGEQHLLEISQAVRALPPVGAPRLVDVLVDGLALLITDGPAAATPTLRQTATALAGISVEEALRWGWMATAAGAAVWDIDSMHTTAARTVGLIRDAGAVAQLPVPLAVLGAVTAWTGDFAGAAAHIAEAESIAAAAESPMAPFAKLRLLVSRGWESEGFALIDRAIEQSRASGQGMSEANAHWAAALLHNGLGRHDEAMSAAQQATSYPFPLYDSMWALPELVEAAARAGHAEIARDALERLTATTQPCGTDFAVGIETRCRALLSDRAAAEELYDEAIRRLSRTQLRPDVARAHLLYGEWLRGEDRRLDARTQLRVAHTMFATIGMDAFAARARRELTAIGDRMGTRSVKTHDQLTPQEEHIARLARDGLSNPEIGAQLFISARTVEWHLRKVFTKLGVRSRRQLRWALSDRGRPAATA
jgi:ATP/maltotriose-dependent transcriptional regulator MalT